MEIKMAKAKVKVTDLKVGRKQCKSEGCRKKQAVKAEYCAAHQKEINNDPYFGIKRLTEVEAERWGRMDSDIRCKLLEQRVKALESKLAEYDEQRGKRAPRGGVFGAQ